jgi:general secretion pathway protein E
MNERRVSYDVHSLLEMLSDRGLVGEADVRSATTRALAIRREIENERQRKGASRRVRYSVGPAEILDRMGLESARDQTALDEDRLMQIIADAAGVPYRKIDPLDLDADLIAETITRPFAERHVCLPLERRGGRLVVAVDNPFDLELQETLRNVTKHEVEIVVSAKSDILKSITETYGFKRAVRGADQELSRGQDFGNLEQFVQLKDVDQLDSNDKHVVNAVEYIFHYAFDQRASDIHIEPKREASTIRMRIDGVLHDVYNLPKPVHLAVTSRIKMLARMDISEKRRPQDGRIKTERNGSEIEMRVSTLPVAFGEKTVIRIFDPQIYLADLSSVGFFADDLDKWEEFVAKRSGLVLVTGPTGSGKTTTLYATLHHCASPRVNITTIEDPIELVVDEFNQVLVQPRIDVTFANALRTILRQDPDIIMVGEIRDAATAQMAIQASLTGHLVFSTLHTNDAPSTIARLLDLGVEPFKIASSLIGVMAQRLVRTICDNCRQEEVLTTDQIEILGIDVPAGPATRLPVQYGAGCVRCRGTGLYGRTGIFEVMPVNSTLRRLIKAESTKDEISAAAINDGMRTLRQCAIRKMAQGITSFDEVAFALGEAI